MEVVFLTFSRARFRSMALVCMSAFILIIIPLAGSVALEESSDEAVLAGETSGVAGMRQVGLTPGDLAPDFTLSSVDGKRVSLSGFREQSPVLLNLWTVSCPSCHYELEELKIMYDDYKGRMEILSVSLDSWYPVSLIEQIVNDKGLPFTVLMDERSTVASLYKVSYVPANYLIDERGVILGVFIGAIDRDRMKTEVEPLLP